MFRPCYAPDPSCYGWCRMSSMCCLRQVAKSARSSASPRRCAQGDATHNTASKRQPVQFHTRADSLEGKIKAHPAPNGIQVATTSPYFLLRKELFFWRDLLMRLIEEGS